MKPNTQKIIDELKEKIWFTNHIWNEESDRLKAKKFKPKEHQDEYISWKVILNNDALKAISKINIEHKKEVEELESKLDLVTSKASCADSIIQMLRKEVKKLEQQLQQYKEEDNNTEYRKCKECGRNATYCDCKMS